MNSAIVATLVLSVIETDSNADKANPVPLWIVWALHIMIIMFAIELGCRIYVKRFKFFCKGMNLIDFSVVFVDMLLR